MNWRPDAEDRKRILLVQRTIAGKTPSDALRYALKFTVDRLSKEGASL